MQSWPKMKRLENDRSVTVVVGAVTIRDDDYERLRMVAIRSQNVLRGLTPRVTLVEPGLAVRDYVHGTCPVTGDEVRVELEKWHKRVIIGRDDVWGPTHCERFYVRRVFDRVQKNCPQHDALLLGWSGWQRLATKQVRVTASWHGDPTVTNAIRRPDGSVTLFDHSHLEYGPRCYDFAKLRRSELINDEMNRIGEVTPEDKRDDVLICVVAGMIGSHGTSELVELFKELTL